MQLVCERCGDSYEAKDRRGKRCAACRPLFAREQAHLRSYVGPRVHNCRDCGVAYETRRSDSFRCAACRESNGKMRSASYELRKKHPCPECGRPKARKAGKCRQCDAKSRIGKVSGSNSKSWKGGRVSHSAGYVEINIDGKYVLEHRYVWQQANGPIPSHVHIHHVNGDKADNRLENLIATDAKGHRHRNRMVDPYIEKAQGFEAHIQTLEARVRELESELNKGS